MGYPDLAKIREEVLDGLESQRPRLDAAQMGQAFWDYRGKTVMAAFLRDAETPFDYLARPYRASGFTRQVIEVLCEHLYSPGPARVWDDPAGDEMLQRIYKDNHFNAMMLRADQLSTLGDCCAIQVDADEGNFEDKPITLRAWGAGDIAVWTDPDNRTVAKVVCTIDRYDDRDLYRLWTDESVSLYEMSKTQQATGGNTTKFISEEPHTYGCLPFSFVHHVQPITTFWEVGIGPMVVHGEIRMNDRLSRVDESMNKHLNPIPVAENVADDFQLIIQPQRFIRISSAKMRPGPTGGYEEGPGARLYYLEVRIDVAGAWEDLTNFINQVLSAIKVPMSAVRMEQQSMASGIALIVEQAPLLTRARARRGPWSLYETDIARTILRATGGYYGRADLVDSAQSGLLSLAWPQPTIPIPTQENLDLLLSQVSARFKSLPMALQEWYGIDREDAFKLLEQIEEDEEELEQRAPMTAKLFLVKHAQAVGVSPNGQDQTEDGEEEDTSSGGTKQDSGTPQSSQDLKQKMLNI